jgi:hypothetical protein
MSEVDGSAGQSGIIPDRKRGVWGDSDSGYGVIGTSDASTGVAGISNSGVGVAGTSTSNYGIVGKSGTSIGAAGSSDSGTGVAGISNSGGGVTGNSKSNFGVTGGSDTSTGVAGISNSGVGVAGTSTSNYGIVGKSGTSIGAAGSSDSGTGLYGISKTGIGVQASGSPAGKFEGDVEVTGDIRLTNADCAEDFDIAVLDHLEPGTVMVLGEEGALEPSICAYDKKVAGVLSGAGDYKPGIILDRHDSQRKRMPVALVGKVHCKVDANYSSIEVGDLLTTSATPGHAMKVTDPEVAFGAVIGKALLPLKTGKGLIPILIALQ